MKMQFLGRLSKIVVIVGSAVACGCRDEPPAVIELGAPVHAADAPFELRQPPPQLQPSVDKPAPPPKWTVEPPHREGVELQMERVRGVLHVSGKGLAFRLPIPQFGGCVDEPTQVFSPEIITERQMRERPVWLVLRSDDEAASLRLSTRGALLIVNDGCERAGDVTHALLGTRRDDEDPLFSAVPVAPDEATDADDLKMRRQGKTNARIYRDSAPLLDTKFFHGESQFSGRALEEKRWVRLQMSKEYEYANNDGVIGREHTLEWRLLPDGVPRLMLDNDYRYGSDGRDREEVQLTATRYFPIDGGLVEVNSRRQTVEEAIRGEKKECSSAVSAFTGRTYEESARWRIERDEGKALDLGTARMTATFANSCLDRAVTRLKKRKRHYLIDRAPTSAVRWDDVRRP